ncbi:response regulator transcription factor [Phycicoccus sp. Soil748]|uniref:response regulator n=1 Tax=Intrasporangiaceae TaxID=85021 RepID=UPI0007038716|nr:response regulator transcription factor [Phycicoccus sp. Soil748]KRE56972.1 LuxR family transcriptional regulator [Phycicoccus sp. Soil748]
MIRVLVADDHPVVRSGLVGVLSTLEGFQVVAVVADGRAAVREAVIHRPDVALMDLKMPDGDGFTAIRELGRVAPAVRICVLTMYDDDDSLFSAMRAGAHGYLLKGSEQEDIAGAVRAVAAGEVVFGPGIATRVLNQLTAPATADARTAAFADLTARELEVLDLLASALPTGAIARRLGLSSKTVSNHVSNILAKLQVADRTQAAMRARDAGLGRPRPQD